MDRGLESRRIEEHRQIEGDTEDRCHNRHPAQASLQPLGVGRSTNRPGAPWNPDHPEAIGEKEEAQSRQCAQGLHATLINRGPLQAFNELLDPEEKGHQGQGHVVTFARLLRDVGAVEPQRHQHR